MKKIAIITAGGTGTRMGQDIPKQFLSIEDKPAIIYTLEIFQKHPEIDHIIVVCLEGWNNVLETYAKQFNITKLSSVVNGGEDGQASIRNGLEEARRLYSEDDMIIIHDGNRVITPADVISGCIATCEAKGNAVAAIPCPEVIMMSEDGITSSGVIDRDRIKRTQTPHAFFLKDILSAHYEAERLNLPRTAASCALYEALGRPIFFCPGAERNIKLTTTEDIEIFQALLHVKHESWLK